MNRLKPVITFGSVIFGFLSAVFWFWSAKVRIPKSKIEKCAISTNAGHAGGMGSMLNPGQLADFTNTDEITSQLSKAGVISMWASVFTGIAVSLQAIANLLPDP